MSEENKISEEQIQIVKRRFCSECGNQIDAEKQFCSYCGKEINDISLKKSKLNINKKIIGIICAVLILIITSAIIYFQSKEKQRQDVRLQYLISINTFKNKVMNAGSNVEDITDTIQTYWNEYIFDKKHGYSIDSAVASAIEDKSTEVDKAKKNDEELLELYRDLKLIPEGNEDLKYILLEVDDLYKSYSSFYNIAMKPSGNYTQYSNSNNDKTDRLLESYRTLDNTIKTNPEFLEVEKRLDDLEKNKSNVMKEYKIIYDSLPKNLQSDDDFKKIIPTFKEKNNIDISKLKKESEIFKDDESIKSTIDIVLSTGESYEDMIKYSKKYNQDNTEENLNKFKSAVLSFRARISVYMISVD